MHYAWNRVARYPAVLAKSQGFTLLELLVSIVIIGLILSMAVLSVGGGRDDEVEEEARRLAALMELAGQEAILKTKELGLRFTPNGYQFMVWKKGDDEKDGDEREDRWQEYVDGVLKARELPEELEFELFLEGLPVTLEMEDSDADEDKKKKKIKPHIILFSSGERSPFELTISVDNLSLDGEDIRYHLEGKMLGTLEVTKRDNL